MSANVPKLENIIHCDRVMWKQLQALDKETLQALKPFVTSLHNEVLLKRRDKLVAHLQSLIDSRGEEFVLFDSVWRNPEHVRGLRVAPANQP